VPRDCGYTSGVIAREGGRPSIPETLMIESRSRGVLDHPLSATCPGQTAPLFWIALVAGIGPFALRLSHEGWWTGHLVCSFPRR